MGEEVKGVMFEDVNLVSYFMAKGKRCIPRVVKNEGGHIRIAFEVFGDLQRELDAYHKDDLIGIQTYQKCLKAAREMIYHLKLISKKA